MEKEKIVNVPNLLSFYRIVAFPFILWMVFADKEKLFALFLCINLVTDILDGLIARTFNLKTKFGARLDSLADVGTYVLAFIGILIFKMDQLDESAWMFWLFFSYFILAHLVSLIKFKKSPSLHLYSVKFGGYTQGIFFFVLFAWQYSPYLFYTAMFVGCLAFTEEIIVLLILKEMKSDAKGLYWILREERQNKLN